MRGDYNEKLWYLEIYGSLKRREVILERYEGLLFFSHFLFLDNFSNGRTSIENIEDIWIIGRMKSKILIKSMLLSRIDKPFFLWIINFIE